MCRAERDFRRPAALTNGVRPILLAVAFSLIAPAFAVADVRIDGHGFGHGVGMAQYGAYGYARMEGRDFRWILDHYYPARAGRRAARRLRVRLKEAVALRVTSAASVRGATAGGQPAHPARRTASSPGRPAAATCTSRRPARRASPRACARGRPARRR